MKGPISPGMKHTSLLLILSIVLFESAPSGVGWDHREGYGRYRVVLIELTPSFPD